MDAETRWWTKLIAFISLAVVGGILGYLMRTLEAGHKPSLSRSILEGVAAGFAGLLLLLLCRMAGFSEEATGIIVGVGGWLGASATIRRLEPIAFAKFGVKKDETGN